ncbi:iron-containing redox enzyme family protein [Nocardia sp. NPDC058058]|uniref:iron-containing redox enzyme family protein n=1 Tax=Nocardia sp. NPDC058058 TaxID=3346317 RepID=UPI0036DC52F2
MSEPFTELHSVHNLPSRERTQLSLQDAHAKIEAIASSCYEHPALNNTFYSCWRDCAWPVADVELFARNFYAHVSPTADRLATLFLRLTDAGARTETVENLDDELGHGDPSKTHAVLLRNMLEQLLSRLHGKPVVFSDIDGPLLPATKRLVRDGMTLFGEPRPEIGCGALLAQEWHAYPQLVLLYEGMRNYMDYFSLEEFHVNSEYFYLHIGATEKEHKMHSISTAARICRDTTQIDLLKHGYDSYLGLLADYWEELHSHTSHTWHKPLHRSTSQVVRPL